VPPAGLSSEVEVKCVLLEVKWKESSSNVVGMGAKAVTGSFWRPLLGCSCAKGRKSLGSAASLPHWPCSDQLLRQFSVIFISVKILG